MSFFNKSTLYYRNTAPWHKMNINKCGNPYGTLQFMEVKFSFIIFNVFCKYLDENQKNY